jgi:hypothetical protein
MVGAWIVTLLPFAYAAIGSYFILLPATISVSGIDRATYIVTQFAALAVIFLLAIVFYVWGQMEKRNQDVVVDLNFGEGTEVIAGAGE